MMSGHSVGSDGLRVDQRVVAEMISANSRVLDVGCGDGALLRHLAQVKGVDARGLELQQRLVSASVAHGLSVIQGNAEENLSFYPDASFDYVVLSQTIQAMTQPKQVLSELLRIGRHAIVSLPNFGYWKVRLQLLLTGRMPVSEFLTYQWYDTPNIHFCTIRDFCVLADEMGLSIERAVSVAAEGKVRPMKSGSAVANIFGEQAVFLLRRL